MRQVGIYGGSFNPIHYGHLRSAIEVREEMGLDEIWMIPSHKPPHKASSEMAASSDRLAMLELAIDGVEGLRAEPIELERSDPSYSIETLRLLRQRNPETNFQWILGFDAFCELHTWYQYESLLPECDFIVTTRPPRSIERGANPEALAAMPIAVREGLCYDETIECHVREGGRRLTFVPVTALNISASALRASLARGRSPRFLLPDPVLEYIESQSLYRG